MDWPTTIVSAVIVAIVAAIIICGIRNRKKGKNSCCGACRGCAMADMCHNHQKSDQ